MPGGGNRQKSRYHILLLHHLRGDDGDDDYDGGGGGGGVSLYIYLSSEISSREKVTIFEWLYSYIENDTRDGLLMSNNVV